MRDRLLRETFQKLYTPFIKSAVRLFWRLRLRKAEGGKVC
ncbi:hypothetical protein HMPREF1548_05347 [Clostridium sp. KLE 1755]|nr:hypothetical protein HMPREF1548_05347 [Clostridium sp. KLE 1755]